MIPDAMARSLITETHEIYGHFGASKTFELLRRDFQLHHMYQQIKKLQRSCDICQKSKVTPQRTRGPLISQIPSKPREIISLDLMEPLPKGRFGAQYILVLLDHFNKHVQIYGIRKATTESILNKIRNDYLPHYGPIERILTDNGTQFHSPKWRIQLAHLNVKVSTTPQTTLKGTLLKVPIER